MLTNTHLKSHDGMTIDQYRTKYPGAKTISDELSQRLSKSSTETNKSRIGVPRTALEIANMREGIKAAGPRTAHNKGVLMTEEQKNLLRAAADERNTVWRENDNHPLKGRTQSEDTKKKISDSVIEYATNNGDELKGRAIIAVETKRTNGYYDRKRIETIAKKVDAFEVLGFTIVDDMLLTDYWTVMCGTCNIVFKRHKASGVHERICRTCYPTQLSGPENEIAEFLKIYTTNVIRQNWNLIDGLEIDIYLPDHKLAIEHDGLFWHSEKQGKNQWYHLMKTNLLAEKGIRLIHIFEDEWIHKQNIVKNRLSAILDKSSRIGARKCRIVSLTSSAANSFYLEHHIQGMANSHYNYGLEFQDQLVAAMSFNTPNRAKGSTQGSFDFELTRYCSQGTVVGGASKLFQHFLRCEPSSTIISYSDKRWNLGNMYLNLGFKKQGDTTPNYWYVDGTKRIYRYKLRLNENDDTNLTEWQNRQKQGWDRIWDCGSTKWLFTR